MIKPFLCLFIFLCGTAILLSAQQYNYKQYTTESGLAADIAYDIMQDHDGFIWIGTGAGISRFDGRNFRNYTTIDGLASNEVLGCIEDPKNRLWINCFSRQVCYYKDGKIFNKKNCDLLSKISFPQLVRNIVSDKDGNIIIWDYAYNIVIIDSNDHVSKYNSASYKLDYSRLKKNSIVEVELLKLPEDTKRVLHQHYFRLWLKPEDIVAKVISDNLIVFITRHRPSECIIWNTSINQWSHQHSPAVRDYVSLGGDAIFITARSGATSLYHYQQQRSIGTFLPGEPINCVFRDQEENLWFTTRGNGIFKLSNRKILVHKLNDQATSVKFIIGKGQDIIVGTENGNYWELSAESSISETGELYSLKSHEVLVSKEMLLNSPLDNLIAVNSSIFTSDQKGSVKSLHVSDGNALIATSTGVFTYRHASSSFDTIYMGRATAAIRHQGHYYIGTLDGLLIADDYYRTVSKLVPYHITYLLADETDAIWVATYDNGIFKLKNGSVLCHIDKENSGMSSDFCRNLAVKEGCLWVGTNNGLNKIKVDECNASVEAIFSTENGLSSNFINAIYIKDSLVYVGTSKGLSIIDQRVKIPLPLANLLFTDILVAGITVWPRQSIILPHGDNKIRFNFSMISFSLESIKYEYRLMGLNREWQEASDPSLSFQSLPGGRYNLQVRATAPSGHVLGMIEKEFEVQKALFEKWWVWAFIISLLIIVAYTIVRYRLNGIRKQEAEKNNLNKRLMELEHTALKAQINPHFIFNCLNSVQNYILKQDTDGANLYLSRFAALIRNTLDNSSRLYTPLPEEIDYIRNYIELEQLQANFPFSYSIINTAIEQHLLFPAMILQPFIENAIKHGLKNKEKDGRLKVEFSKVKNNTIICIIEDNGCGMDASAMSVVLRRHKPKGILLIKNRIDVLNTINNNIGAIELKIDDLRNLGGHGTRVQICVPVS